MTSRYHTILYLLILPILPVLLLVSCKKPTVESNYTVTFASNGGTDVKIQTVREGQKVTKPSEPTRAGYTFAGWYADNSFQQLFSFYDPITTAITLYAKWNKEFTVTFDSGRPVLPKSITSNQKVDKPANPTRTGYVFGGWYVDKGFQQLFNFDASITAAITLYAKWYKELTVTFDSGEGGSSVPSKSVGSGQKVDKPANPTRTNYAFLGWYGDQGFQQLFDFDHSPITSDTTLYANWDQTTFMVSFSSEGSVTVPSHNIEKGQMTSKPDAPKRLGYFFAGWYGDKGLQQPFNFANTITADTTLYAKWNEGYIVTFDTRGGTTIKPVTVAKGGTLSASTPPTSGKLTLLHWYAESAFTNIFNIPATINASITLYAKYGFRVPDDNFRNKLKILIGAAFKGDVMDTAHTVVTGLATLDVDNSAIKSLAGIEYFTGLTKLWCNNNELTSLDVSKNRALRQFSCNNNRLVSLDIRGMVMADELNINAGSTTNPLTTLKVSNSLKEHLEIKEAKTNRGTAITITTYNDSDPTTIICNNYNPLQNRCSPD